MGVNQKKIDRMVQLKQWQEEYQEFIKSLNLQPLVDYFELGIKAKQFKRQDGKVLGRNDQLFFGFNNGGYQYTLRRQPLHVSGNNMNAIINEMLQKK